MLDDYVFDSLKEVIEHMEAEKSIPGWFSLKAISDVPYIEYQGFTKEENLEVQEQIKNVLRLSKDNQYKESCIMYRLDEKGQRTYAKIKGDALSVPFDKEMMNGANEEKQLVIVALHNHLNTSRFSISDLSVFCDNPAIRLMVVVNRDGEISYLQRPSWLELKEIASRYLLTEVSNLRELAAEWKIKNPGKKMTLYAVIDDDEKWNKIIDNTIDDILLHGAIYVPYPSERERKTELDKQEIISESSKPEGTVSQTFENGENNFEMEERDDW